MHAHVKTQALDCDGFHSTSYVLVKDERHTDDQFQGAVLSTWLPFGYLDEDDAIDVTFTRHGFSFHVPTDEGFESVDVVWCTPHVSRDKVCEYIRMEWDGNGDGNA